MAKPAATRTIRLDRFRAQRDPEAAIAAYLAHVHAEAVARDYNFAAEKVGARRQRILIPVTRGQLDYEWQHLHAKLGVRDPDRLTVIRHIRRPQCHPSFQVIAGGVEAWEKT
ncbi:MAG TPA: hypothetical protein VF284_08450 [Rhodanobacteraceae bacterium]